MVFIAAGVAKSFSPEDTLLLLQTLTFDGIPELAVYALAVGELCLGYWLVTAKKYAIPGLIAAVLFVAFTMILVIANNVTGISDCGCFGSLLKSDIQSSIRRNIGFTIVATLCLARFFYYESYRKDQ